MVLLHLADQFVLFSAFFLSSTSFFQSNPYTFSRHIMSLDARTILCMSQYNKTDIYTLLDEGTQYHLISVILNQGSSEPLFRTIGTASKQSLVEIRRPLDCYGRSTISSFVAIMPGTKDVYPNPTLNGIRIDFGNNGSVWRPVIVNVMYNEATAPTTSVLYDGTSIMHYLEGPTGQRLRKLARNSTGQFANIVTEISSVSQVHAPSFFKSISVFMLFMIAQRFISSFFFTSCFCLDRQPRTRRGLCWTHRR